MSHSKRDPDYPAELETQFILRLPDDPAKALTKALRSEDPLKNRLAILINDDMRYGKVRFDDWIMHSKIVDLPTVIESLKTIDNKNFYKTADICQMMVCTEKPDQTASEDESTSKSKKKDLKKVDKKFIWPHGLTPPLKNIRKKRFRKTLKKKNVETPNIEKEVKRLLRADNEAECISWEIVNEDIEQLPKKEPDNLSSSLKPTKKTKKNRHAKKKDTTKKDDSKKKTSKKVESKKASSKNAGVPNMSKMSDIFGGTVSDSDNDEVNLSARMALCESVLLPSKIHKSDIIPIDSAVVYRSGNVEAEGANKNIEFEPPILPSLSNVKKSKGHLVSRRKKPNCTITKAADVSPCDDEEQIKSITSKFDLLRMEIEELKRRREQARFKLEGMENSALRKRFEDTLKKINKDVKYKEKLYRNLIRIQISEKA